MSEIDEQAASNLASHTLAFMRRIDRRQDEFVDLLTRQQDLVTRLERSMREGFAALDQRLDHVDRDLREIKGDMLLLENKLLNRMSAEYGLSRRLERVEEKLAVEADEDPSPSAI